MTTNTRMSALIIFLLLFGCTDKEDIVPGTEGGEQKKEEGLVKEEQSISKVSFDQFLGVCSFVDVPGEYEAPFHVVRDYFNVKWVTVKNPADLKNVKYMFNPSSSFGGNWNFDNSLKRRRDDGLQTVLCLKNTFDFLESINVDGKKNFENQPIDNGYTFAQSNKPEAYTTYAKACFQIAARYGSTQVEETRLNLTDNQKPLSGLGYIDYLELWNEPNKWWEDEYANFTAEEFGAFLSACLDGNNGKIKDAGILQADPTMKVVTGGITKFDTQYLDDVFSAMAKMRGQSVSQVAKLFHSVSLHHYSHNGVENPSKRTQGISPEDDKLQESVAGLKKWIGKYPGLQLSIGEFGYDTQKKGSKQHSPELYDLKPEQAQAAWLLRSYLAIFAGGADVAKMYMIRDAGDYGTYGTSGVMTKKGDYRKKISWYMIATAAEVLKNCVFDKSLSNGYQLVDRGNKNKTVLVLWSADKEIDYKVEGTFQSARLVQIAEGKKSGIVTNLDLENPTVKGIGNMPVFVELIK